jgi:hypothetical protein
LYPSGNAKYNNVRVWSVLRFDSEIANNYNTCLTNNETGLDINYMFDGFNQKNIANKAINSLVKYGVIEGNGYSFSNGSGCGVTPPFSLVVVTGSFAGTYYYAGMFNGKPRYQTDNLECGIFLNESHTIMLQGSHKFFGIVLITVGSWLMMLVFGYLQHIPLLTI